MEVRYPVVLLAGALVCFFLLGIILYFRMKKRAYKSGKKISSLQHLADNPYFKRKKMEYRVLHAAFVMSLIGAIFICFVMLARPYKVQVIDEEKYARDIILCLDVSSSVDELNDQLVQKLKDTVRELKGERFGIVIFNTSPLLLVPLTDDYEYVIEQLDNIHKSLKQRISLGKMLHEDDDYFFYMNYLTEGTLVGNEERGSSLIGDGLASCLNNFSKNDTEKTKIIIFSTDNDLEGEPVVSLMDAAKLCKKNNATVYGIGTKEMYTEDMEDMKSAVELTGGKFYLEEESGSFSDIVASISKQSQNLVKGSKKYKKTDMPKGAYHALVFLIVLLGISGTILRQTKLRPIIWAACLIGIALTMKHAGQGEDVKVNPQDQYVLFVVDDTLSMYANDYKGGKPRMTGVIHDSEQIIDAFPGCKYGVISFHNEANMTMPFSDNAEYAKSVIESITPIGTLYAKGTSVNTCKETVLAVLKDIYDRKGKKTYVFYFGDGENNTDEDMVSFSELNSYIEDGAVFGYGTLQGGNMYIKDLYDDELELVEDPETYDKAVSKIDEKTLERLAKDFGVTYHNQTYEAPIDELLAQMTEGLLTVDVSDVAEDAFNEEELLDFSQPRYLVFVAILSCLLIVELVVFNHPQIGKKHEKRNAGASAT